MTKKQNIFSKDVEIPDVVMQKANEAFCFIRQEKERNRTVEKISCVKKKHVRRSMTGVALAAIVVIGSVGGMAAARYFWSRGMKGMLQATSEQQQQWIEEKKMITGFESVVDAGVTITPKHMTGDERFVYLSFLVEGYVPKENSMPVFEKIRVHLGEKKTSGVSRLNMSGGFYDGIVMNENGQPVYEDGTSLEVDENGRLKYHYLNGEEKLEYVMVISKGQDQLFQHGDTLHISFENIGTANKLNMVECQEGIWEFELELVDFNSTVKKGVNRQVQDTCFQIDTIEISPISVKLNYNVYGEAEVLEDETGVPDFGGLVLENGERILMAGSGAVGYTDETKAGAYCICAFNRVIDLDTVCGVLIRTMPGGELIEMEIR